MRTLVEGHPPRRAEAGGLIALDPPHARRPLFVLRSARPGEGKREGTNEQIGERRNEGIRKRRKEGIRKRRNEGIRKRRKEGMSKRKE